MRTIEDSCRGITLVVMLGWDRMLGLGIVGFALWIAAAVGPTLH